MSVRIFEFNICKIWLYNCTQRGTRIKTIRRCLVQNTYWDVELFSYKPDILRTLLRIAVNAMAQSTINKTRFLHLPAPSNQIMQSQCLNLGGFTLPVSPSTILPTFLYAQKALKNVQSRPKTIKNFEISAPTYLRNAFRSCSVLLKSALTLCHVCDLN